MEGELLKKVYVNGYPFIKLDGEVFLKQLKEVKVEYKRRKKYQKEHPKEFKRFQELLEEYPKVCDKLCKEYYVL